jgi:hypothetical protein
MPNMKGSQALRLSGSGPSNVSNSLSLAWVRRRNDSCPRNTRVKYVLHCKAPSIRLVCLKICNFTCLRYERHFN